MLPLKLATETLNIWVRMCLLFLGTSSLSGSSEANIHEAVADAVLATFSEGGVNSFHLKLLYNDEQRGKLGKFALEVSKDLNLGNKLEGRAYDQWVVSEVVGDDFFKLLNFYLGRADIPSILPLDFNVQENVESSFDLGWLVALNFREEDLSSHAELRERTVVLLRHWVAFVDQFGMIEVISKRMLSHFAGFFSTLDVIAGSDQIVGQLTLGDIDAILKIQKSVRLNQNRLDDQELKSLAIDSIRDIEDLLKRVARVNQKLSVSLSAFKVSRLMKKLTLLQKEQAVILTQDALISDCLNDTSALMRTAPELLEWMVAQSPKQIEGDSLQLLNLLDSSIKLSFGKDERLPVTSTLIEGVKARLRDQSKCCGN